MTLSAALLLGGLTLQACSSEKIADNTTDAVVFVGKTAVKGVVGAGKLAVRGGKAAVEKARGSDAEKGDFPPGTAVCTNASGGYYEALKTEDGTSVCLPKKAPDPAYYAHQHGSFPTVLVRTCQEQPLN